MTFDAFLNAITGSAVADWVRVAGRNPGELRFVLRSDVATTLELGGPARLDAAAEAGWGAWASKTQLRQLDCFCEGRLVYGDVVMLAATGNGLLPLPRNRAEQVGTARRDLARLVHRLVGHLGDFDQLFTAASLSLKQDEPLA